MPTVDSPHLIECQSLNLSPTINTIGKGCWTGNREHVCWRGKSTFGDLPLPQSSAGQIALPVAQSDRQCAATFVLANQGLREPSASKVTR